MENKNTLQSIPARTEVLFFYVSIIIFLGFVKKSGLEAHVHLAI